MKDGFDKSVAEKMPKIQRKRPNRPWNVDPVLINAQEESRARKEEARQARKGEKEAGEALKARQVRTEGQAPGAPGQPLKDEKESEALQAKQAGKREHEPEVTREVQDRKEEKESRADLASVLQREEKDPAGPAGRVRNEEAGPAPARTAMPEREAAAESGGAEALTRVGDAPKADPAKMAVSLDKELDVLSLNGTPGRGNGDLAKAVETIKDINSDFTQIIFERKAIQQKLDRSARTIEEVERENAQLKEKIASFEKDALDNTLIEREIDFLNEQLEDADLYIQNMMGLLEEKAQNIEQESSLRRDLESRFEKISREIHEKAKLDVKVSILERDLNISHTRIQDLESRLEDEYQKREPLEQEIVELKNALDRVYSSLAHIRLKAKREVYGS